MPPLIKTLSLSLALLICLSAPSSLLAAASENKPNDAKVTKSSAPAKPALIDDEDDADNATVKPSAGKKPTGKSASTDAKSKSGIQASPVKPPKTKVSSKKKQTPTWLSNTKNVSAHVGSFIAGTAIGIPIAVPRLFVRADIEHAQGMPLVGDSKHAIPLWISRLAAVPTAGALALVSAPYYSGVRAWRETAQEPFSKECFSLGEFDDTIWQP